MVVGCAALSPPYTLHFVLRTQQEGIHLGQYLFLIEAMDPNAALGTRRGANAAPLAKDAVRLHPFLRAPVLLVFFELYGVVGTHIQAKRAPVAPVRNVGDQALNVSLSLERTVSARAAAPSPWP